MSGNEQGVIDAFNGFMVEAAGKQGIKYQPFSMGSADEKFADYLCSAGSRFALIEFKDTDDKLSSERAKAKRLLLCQALEAEVNVLDIHDRGHFISWSNHSDGELWLNIYRHEICNCKRMGKGQLSSEWPNEHERVGAETFALSFFNPVSRRGLKYEALRQYVAWVCKVQGGTESVDLIMRRPGTASIRRFGFDQLQEVLGQLPGPPPPAPPRRVPGGLGRK